MLVEKRCDEGRDFVLAGFQGSVAAGRVVGKVVERIGLVDL